MPRRMKPIPSAWTKACSSRRSIPATEDYSVLALTCAKNNNGQMFSPFAVRLDPDMIYQREPAFDMDALREQIEKGKTTRGLQPEILRELLTKGHDYSKKQIVDIVIEEKGGSPSRAYDLVDRAVTRRILRRNRLTKVYALA